MAHSHKARDAAARYAALRAHGVPMTLSPRDAWYLSGGVIGRQHDTTGERVPLARIARDVADCLAFLEDYEEATECEGHESLSGEFHGAAVVCDGTCRAD